MRKCKSDRGSLTIEAVLSVPVFLSFFLFLAFAVKVASINMILNQAVTETAKQMATSCYPVSFLNELEDEVFSRGTGREIPSFSEEALRVKDYLSDNTSNLIQKLLTGDIGREDLIEAFNSIKGNVADDYISGLAGYVANTLGEDYYSIKAKAKYKAADLLLDKFLEGSWINRESVEILFVGLPQSDTEYYARNEEDDGSYRALCEEMGAVPGQEDVVLSLRYRVKIPIPFFKDREINYIFTAMERAWIHGSNGVYTVHENSGGEAPEEGEETESVEESYKKLQQSTVYVTKYGIKYHKSSCRYLAKSKIPLKIEDALKKGYEPCKKCYGR